MKVWMLRNENWIVSCLIVAAVIIVSIQAIALGDKFYGDNGPYTYYNNYVIFKESFSHLLNGENLYAAYPEQQWDIFKYTPSFALFFGFFKVFPDTVGIVLWNLLNAGTLIWALIRMKKHIKFTLYLPVIFLLPELITSMQNFQSNALIAGLVVHAWIFLERKNIPLAVLCIVSAIFIKPFAIVALAMFLLYPGKMKATLWAIFSTSVIFFFPSIVTGFSGLIDHYDDWILMLKSDHDHAIGISFAGIIQSVTGAEISKTVILFAGVAVFVLPFIRWKNFTNVQFRALLLASVLIWVVIFNHKAESPTFIIAVLGVAIWYLNGGKNIYEKILFGFCFVLTCLSATDIFPPFVKNVIVKPYHLKALPCVIIWLVVIAKMMTIGGTKVVIRQTHD